MESISSTNWIASPKSDCLNVTDQSAQKLSNLILGLPATNITGTTDRYIREIVYDSRKSRFGSLFVAVPGENWDGGAFIQDALDKGASTFITETSLDSLSRLDLGSLDVCLLYTSDAADE